ncbi:hypothetical protein DICPUDRAFT_27214 [Dictyostelium purpureum]|uniref:Pentacotripeptide-repeat region of PRORP domain-containing protein n=1 Tax=Dictyostelium purpureum TaxID=5786 RepID=F0Z9U6_DICPU|nr:uncharacterized protein DICPUDRAFT_27214 [Dictyostelium purpureum]EGC39275.1 hypothetical protein DICPUDRAFT_27214 [Dictyostelium purpureum]|eukprot:XP_003284179.1 hypothetical protein DICPUDRAFT_27214 [Dictyostelium purpureum]
MNCLKRNSFQKCIKQTIIYNNNNNIASYNNRIKRFFSVNSNNNNNNIVKNEEIIKEITNEGETIKFEVIVKEPIIHNETVRGMQVVRESPIKVQNPINPFAYSVETVEDALSLPDLKPIGIDNTYATGVMHENLKQSMPYLKQLIQENQTEKAFSLFQVMERFYVPVSEECYALLRKEIEKAMVEVALFNDAIKQEEEKPGSVPEQRLYIPPIKTLNTLLNYYTETDKLPEAFRLFTTMKLLDVKPNQHTYRSLINASIRYEDIELALIFYENMRTDGVVLEEQTYERLFDTCCNTVHYDGAVDLYKELVERFKRSSFERCALLTTLGATRFMYWMNVPQSVTAGRGYVTSLQVSPTRFIFPPKHENHKLLEPKLPKKVMHKLTSRKNKNGGLLPFN